MAIFSLFTRPAYALQPPSISQADIQMRLGELYCHQGEYKKANAAYKQAFVLGGDADDVYFGLGYCHVKRLQSEDIHSGNNYHTDQALAHKRIKQRKKALSIFSLITPNSRNKTDVDKWAAYLKAEITLAQDELNRDNQLGFYDEVCTYSIYDLYDSQIFTGRFETEETDCIPYQTQYRTLFRANWQD